MINEKYRDTVIEVKKALSSKAGYFEESKAPCLGGPMHGDFWGMEHTIIPCAQIAEDSRGNVLMNKRHFYLPHDLTISEEDGKVRVYAHWQYLNEEEIYRVFEAWSAGFLQEMEEVLTGELKI